MFILNIISESESESETALLRVYNDVMLCIDQGKGCILVLLDLSAAFDTVDHAVLFNLLEHSLGISSGTALFLLNRIYRVALNLFKLTELLLNLQI